VVGRIMNKLAINREKFLLELCEEIYLVEKKCQQERDSESCGNAQFYELVLIKKDKVRVEIRKESVSHHCPHIHIKHSDKFDVSISLKDFTILAGNIDKRTEKTLLPLLQSKSKELNEIWNELNEKDSSENAEKLISNLDFK
jgi:hypothetical protein